MNLTIVNDNVLELDESFHVSLESIQALNNPDKINRIHIISANAEINIIDDDGGDCTYVICSNTCMCIDRPRWVGAGTCMSPLPTSFHFGACMLPCLCFLFSHAIIAAFVSLLHLVSIVFPLWPCHPYTHLS